MVMLGARPAIQNPAREFQGTPVVKLGDQHFKKVQGFEKRFGSWVLPIHGSNWCDTHLLLRRIPDITELDHLTINGDVWIGKKVTLAGTVIIGASSNIPSKPFASRLTFARSPLPVANEGNRIYIPDGSKLENSEWRRARLCYPTRLTRA
jgi:UTP--glucose-1-phosphate uridylyltransferase